MTMNVIYLIELQQENGAGYYRYNIYASDAVIGFSVRISPLISYAHSKGWVEFHSEPAKTLVFGKSRLYFVSPYQNLDDGLFKWLNIGKTAAAAVFTLTGSDQEPVFLLRKEKFFQLKNGTRAELSRSHSELAKGLLTNNSQWQAYFSGGSLEVIIPIK